MVHGRTAGPSPKMRGVCIRPQTVMSEDDSRRALLRRRGQHISLQSSADELPSSEDRGSCVRRRLRPKTRSTYPPRTSCPRPKTGGPASAAACVRRKGRHIVRGRVALVGRQGVPRPQAPESETLPWVRARYMSLSFHLYISIYSIFL